MLGHIYRFIILLDWTACSKVLMLKYLEFSDNCRLKFVSNYASVCAKLSRDA